MILPSVLYNESVSDDTSLPSPYKSVSEDTFLYYIIKTIIILGVSEDTFPRKE